MINGKMWMRLALMCALCVTSAEAQYRRTPRDTVRVREVTNGRSALTTPNGTVELRTEHDATVVVAFGGADSARAWYESLHIAVVSAQARQEPPTREALSRPFDLSFDARGRIRTLSAPEFPAAITAVSDLSHEFDDLFARLPVGPLSLGLVWEDTAVVETRLDDNGFLRDERFIRSRVVRDTTFEGESAWLIESVQRSTLALTQRVKGQPLTARTALSGGDSGVFVFSKQNGRMLARQRSGGVAGTLTYEGGPQPVVLPMQYRYENTVRSIP